MWLPAEVGTNGSHGDTDQQFFTSEGAETATRLAAAPHSPWLLVLLVASLASNLVTLVSPVARSPLSLLLSVSDLCLAAWGLASHLQHRTQQVEVFSAFCLSLYFPLVSSIGITIHLLAEMAAVIKIPRQHTSKDPETNQRRAPWSRDWCGPMREAVVACVWLVAVSVVLALLTCLTISRGFSFCSYYSGRQLQCAPYTHTGPVEARLSLLLQVLINPVYFPLTVTAVLPIMITLASHHSLFYRPEAAPLPRPGWLQEAGSRRLGWLMFTAVYSLFLTDLILYGQGEPVARDLLVLPEPLSWRHAGGSVVRNIAVLAICSFL